MFSYGFSQSFGATGFWWKLSKYNLNTKNCQHGNHSIKKKLKKTINNKQTSKPANQGTSIPNYLTTKQPVNQ